MARPRRILRILSRRTRVALPLVVVLVSGAACSSPSQRVQGRQGVLATYTTGRLYTDFGPEVRIPALVAASDAALRSRGYTVTSRDVTLDQGTVKAKRPGNGLFEQVVVEAKITSSGSRLIVRREPFGDEATSRAILDHVLAHLM